MEQLQKFWTLVVEVWDHGLWGVDIGKIAAALLIFLLFLLIRRLFSHFIVARLQRLAGKTKTNFDDALLAAIEGPLRFVPVTLGVFLSFEVLDLNDEAAALAGNLVKSLIVFTIFWGFYNAVGPVSTVLEKLKAVFTDAMVQWLVKAIRFAIILIGAAAVLELWGIEVGPILAGLGLFGVAVALGAQDLFKNLIAGILIIAERRFQPGDWVAVDGVVEGTVEVIGFRSTRIRRFDLSPTFVPNAKLSDSAVTNFSEMLHRRIYWKIGLEYRTNVEQLRKIRDEIEAYIRDSGDYVNPPKASMFVRIDSFNDSSIDVLLYCFTQTTNWGEWLRIKEELAYRIKYFVVGGGSGFAFPSLSVYVETLPSEQPDTFEAPSEK
ncbi:MAG: mechanosensitive ion channel family protein [Pseudomonadota bacterium]